MGPHTVARTEWRACRRLGTHQRCAHPTVYPSLAACLQHAGGPPMVAATLVLLGWNLISWVPEVLLLRYAQRLSPALAAGNTAKQRAAHNSATAAAANGGQAAKPGGGLQRQLAAWALYARQPAAAAALALSLLYFTVLSFGEGLHASACAAGTCRHVRRSVSAAQQAACRAAPLGTQ